MRKLVVAVVCLILLLSGSVIAADNSSKLSVWLRTGQWESAATNLKEFVDWFKDNNPDIELEIMLFDTIDQLVAAYAGGLDMDVIQLTYNWLPVLGINNMIADLDPFMAKDTYVNRHWVPTALIERGRYRNIIGGITEAPTWRLLMLSPSRFAAAGVAVPSRQGATTWTVDEFITSITRLQRIGSDGRVSRYGFSFSTSLDRIDNWVRLWGGQVYDVSSNRITLDSVNSLAGLRSLRSLIVEKQLTPDNPGEFANSAGLTNDRVGIYLGPDGQLPELEMTIPGDYTVVPMPRGPAGTHAIMHGSYLAISANSTNSEQAWRFLQARFLDSIGIRSLNRVPNRFPFEAYLSKYMPLSVYKDLKELALEWLGPYAYAYLPYPGMDEAEKIMSTVVTQYITGQVSEDVLKEAITRANMVVARY